MGCYSALKRNKILIHATTWWTLDFMINEIKWVTQLCLILCNPMDYSPWNSPGQRIQLATGVGSCSLLQGIFPTQVSHIAGRFFTSWTAAAKSLQLCPTLWDPIDGSPPGSAILGILQARTLEWVAISFSNAWKWKVKVKSLSRVWLLATPWTAVYQAPPPMGFSRQEYWSGVPLPSPTSWATRHKKINIVWFHLYEEPQIVKFMESESRTVVVRANRGSVGSYYFMSAVSVWDDKKLLEIKSDDGCMVKWIYWMPGKVYFKIIKMVNFKLPIFYQNTKEEEFCPLLPSLPYLISWLP